MRIDNATQFETTRPPVADATCRALSVRACAKRYGVGRTTIYKHIRDGSIRIVKIGTRTLIVIDDAERWINSLRAGAM